MPSLDPAGAYDTVSWALFSNVLQTLLTYEPRGSTPVPDAAKSCSFKGSGLRREHVVSSEAVGGGQYLSDGTGVFRLWSLGWT